MNKESIVKKLIKRKVFWLLPLVILFIFPIIAIVFNEWLGWSWGKLIIITPDSKVFLTLWTTAFGVVGLIINIVINSSRLTNQEEQLRLHSKNERNSRFSKAIELLGNNHESARIGAAHTLISLAKEYKEEYRKLVFDILCSHIRTTTYQNEYRDLYSEKPSNEIQTIIEILFKKEADNKSLFEGLKADLNGSFLKGLYLHDAAINYANFKDVNLTNSKLTNVDFIGTNFLNTNFRTEMLSNCNFQSSVISNSHFEGTMLNGCHFTDSSISYTHFEQTTMFSSHFEGANINMTHFEGVNIDDGHFEGSNISCCLFVGSEIFKAFFNGALLNLNVKFCGASIEEVSFDGTYLNRVNFEGCALDKVSLLGGGDYEFSNNDRSSFNRDRTFLLEKQKNKKTVFSNKLKFGLLNLEGIRRIEKWMKDSNVDSNIITNIYKKLSNIPNIESNQDNFTQGILGIDIAELSIKKLKEIETKCKGWRQNRK